MSAPLIYSGRRAKLLTQDGLLRPDGSIIDNNGTPNLIKNGHAEINVTGWTVSKNTVAASRPDSGFVTSSTNITWTRNTTNPIDGQADFLYTKDAANRQGEQVYCGFTVSKKYRAKVLQIEVDYLVNSGTFSAGSSSSDSDIIVYIYDVTNSTFIEPSSFKFLSNSSTIADKFVANFQTSATGSSYRILFHQATTSSSAFAVQFKDVRVSPCQYVYGTPISDWFSFTPTGSWTSNTTYTGMWRRVGDSMEIQAKATLSGAPNGVQLYFNMPTGYSIDGAKTFANFGAVGSSTMQDAGVASYMGGVQLLGNLIYPYTTANPSSGVLTTVPFTFGSGDAVTIDVRVPITGWSSSSQVSDGYDGRQIAAKIGKNLNQSIPNATVTKVTFNSGWSGSFDKTNSFDYTNNRFVCPSSGLYRVSGALSWGANASGIRTLEVYKNGSGGTGILYSSPGSSAAEVRSNGSILVDCKAGDYLEIYAYQDSGVALNISGLNGEPFNYIQFEKLSSPQTMSATEVVAAKYYGIPTGSIGSPHQTITYPTKAFDTHNAYSGGTYTIPVAGIYEVYAYVEVAGTETLGQSVNIATYKNGSVETFMATTRAPGTVSNTGVGGSTLVNCVAGDTIQIKVYTDISSPSYVYADATPRFEIKRIK